MTIYQDALKAGLEIDSHESDLYLKDCPKARELLEQYQEGMDARDLVFVSQIDGENWLDIPFAFDPFWESKPR